MNAKVSPAMERTTAGLRTVLLDEIDSLRNGQTTEGRAHAIARLVNAAIASVRLEMDAHEFISREGEKPSSPPARSVAASLRPLGLVA